MKSRVGALCIAVIWLLSASAVHAQQCAGVQIPPLGISVTGEQCPSGTCVDWGNENPASGFTVQFCCGDGNLDTYDLTLYGGGVVGEQCDDGNNASGDSCSPTCTPPADVCGDSVVGPSESCDDGNDTPNDGCNASCQVESGFECIGTGPGSCVSTCGNYRDNVGEFCDTGRRCSSNSTFPGLSCDNDGDCNGGGICVTENGDGCSATCQVEPSSICINLYGETDTCYPSTQCGNGIVEPLFERCDPSSSSCNSVCSINEPFQCGDGTRDTGAVWFEECDQGANNGFNPSCSSLCRTPLCTNTSTIAPTPTLVGDFVNPGSPFVSRPTLGFHAFLPPYGNDADPDVLFVAREGVDVPFPTPPSEPDDRRVVVVERMIPSNPADPSYCAVQLTLRPVGTDPPIVSGTAGSRQILRFLTTTPRYVVIAHGAGYHNVLGGITANSISLMPIGFWNTTTGYCNKRVTPLTNIIGSTDNGLQFLSMTTHPVHPHMIYAMFSYNTETESTLAVINTDQINSLNAVYVIEFPAVSFAPWITVHRFIQGTSPIADTLVRDEPSLSAGRSTLMLALSTLTRSGSTRFLQLNPNDGTLVNQNDPLDTEVFTFSSNSTWWRVPPPTGPNAKQHRPMAAFADVRDEANPNANVYFFVQQSERENQPDEAYLVACSADPLVPINSECFNARTLSTTSNDEFYGMIISKDGSVLAMIRSDPTNTYLDTYTIGNIDSAHATARVSARSSVLIGPTANWPRASTNNPTYPGLGPCAASLDFEPKDRTRLYASFYTLDGALPSATHPKLITLNTSVCSGTAPPPPSPPPGSNGKI